MIIEILHSRTRQAWPTIDNDISLDIFAWRFDNNTPLGPITKAVEKTNAIGFS